MLTTTHTRKTGRRALAAVASLALSGCALLPSDPVPESVPIPDSQVDAIAEAGAVPAPSAPVPPPPPRARAPDPQDVVILFDDTTPGYADIAARVAEALPPQRYRVELASVQALALPDAFGALENRPPFLSVAVGLEAVQLARERSSGPIIFCQVFNYQELLAAGGPLWGVQSIPPPALQLRSWKAIDPSLRRIGLIVSQVHVPLAQEAVEAGERIAIEVEYAVSSSDRETLYLAKRLAADVDGLWVLPDNRILSPAVLEESLSYALSHGVGVLVFNEALLPWGALISANSTASDVARSVLAVLERVAAGRTDGLPMVTPLSEVELRINEHAAVQLGLTGGFSSPWVLRDPD